MPMVLASFLRLVTSPKIFQWPTRIEEAIGFVDALLLVPGAQLAELGVDGSGFVSCASTTNSLRFQKAAGPGATHAPRFGVCVAGEVAAIGKCWWSGGAIDCFRLAVELTVGG